MIYIFNGFLVILMATLGVRKFAAEWVEKISDNGYQVCFH
jgi:hypothetical protein